MSVSDFSSTRNKKRARVKGTYIDNRPEMKTWNAGFKSDYYPSSLILVNPCMKLQDLSRSDGWGSWTPMELQMPSPGNNSSQHIGKKINIKWLRFKGYVRSYSRLFAPARWRLVLYRADFQMQDILSNTSKLKPLWLNYEDPLEVVADTNQMNNIHSRCCHNFYKLIKDVEFWKLHNVSRTVICSGVLQPPPWRDPQGYYSAAGSTSQFGKMQHSTYWWHSWYTNDYINAKIDLNDTYTYAESVTGPDQLQRVSAPSCYYAIQLETDQGLGVTGVADTTFLTSTADSFSRAAADRLFELNFFIRGYFTDA